MELSSFSVSELIEVYSNSIKELKKRGILRTKNVVGELGEYLVLEFFCRNSELPNLSIVPVGTKNINAISQDGERYSIKSTTGNVTGVFYGLEPQGSEKEDTPIFEYVIICKLDDDCELEGIYQLSWDMFKKHKRWHSRMKAWNVTLSKAMKKDAITIYEKDSQILSSDEMDDEETAEDEAENIPVITWNKTKVNHGEVRERTKERLQTILKCSFNKSSSSRYVSPDKKAAVYILSATYNEKNVEYWYSINDENLPWMRLFPTCYIAFALGSAEQVLLFKYGELEGILEGCLRTQENPDIKKKAHYHFSFAVEGSKVFFKKKLPEREFVDITHLLV